MANGHLGNVLQQIRRLFGVACDPGTDGTLLDRFVRDRDEPAFEALVQRHGPLVLSVCRRVLADTHLADDAFQATFLVLARKAGSIRRREALSSWLYGVAYRTAARLRSDAARRRVLERQAETMPHTDPLADVAWRELQPLLDQELNGLPEKYRAPLVLCYLEGKTHQEAALLLHWPMGTVGGRLARARELLRKRLTRRGVTLSTVTLGGLVADTAGVTPVRAALLRATVQAALPFATGQPVPGAASSVLLAEGVLHTMFLTRLTYAVTVFLVLAVLSTAAGLWTYRHSSAEARGAAARADGQPAAPRAEEEKSKSDPPGVPLEARLVAKKDTYKLNLAGQTPEQFRKRLEAWKKNRQGELPPVPTVDVELVFKNRGDKDIKFLIGPDGAEPRLDLRGDGSVTISVGFSVAGRRSISPKEVTLAPGKSFSYPIKNLALHSLIQEQFVAYWTQAGDYTLTAIVPTQMIPAPAGAKKIGDWGKVTITSAPVKVRVVEAKD